MSSQPVLRPIDDRTHRLLNSPPVMDHLPVVFDNGFKVTEFSGSCIKCDQSIGRNYMLGTVSRPFPFVAVIEARGVCPQCRIATRFKMRIKEDGRAEYLDANGSWAYQYFRKPSTFRRALALLKWIWN